jgi:hypothetical protein
MSEFYVFPNGTYEANWAGEYEVIKYRTMPCTPMGDLIIKCKTKHEAVHISTILNWVSHFMSGIDLDTAKQYAAKIASGYYNE